MTVRSLVNGCQTEAVSVLDRGLQYGDGVFETALVKSGRAVAWARHQRRLLLGCARLGIEFHEITELAHEIEHLCDGVERAVLKVIVTRGVSGRGYRPLVRASGGTPTRIVQLHPDPGAGRHATSGVRITVCRTPWSINSNLAQIKHLNRLEQILARSEFREDEVREGLMLDTEGNIISATAANVFFVRAGELITPDLTRCGVAGITREIVMELAAQIAIPVTVRAVSFQDLHAADEIFLTNSVMGLWPVSAVDKRLVPGGPIAARLETALEHRLMAE